MRWEVYVLSLAIIFCLAFPAVASECMDIKCCWEPCGEKVEEAEYDAVYALTKDFMLIGYYDVNSNNRFDADDGLYIDAVFDWQSTRWETEAGDVRLTDFCNTYQPNTKIAQGDSDAGMQLKPLPNSCFYGQAVVGFVDVNNDGVYDLGDPLYVDTDGSSDVSVNDVRLTDDAATVADESYTLVTLADAHEGEDLRDIVTYQTRLVTPIFSMLGYIDSDCSMTWTCVDKLYLQQLNSQCYAWKTNESVIDNLQVDGLEDIAKFVLDDAMRTMFFEPCYFVTDCVVSIGDFRIYIPPTAIDEEGWPECGTKVKQMDIDAVYALSKDFMLIGYYDVNSNNRFDADDGLYIDAVVDWYAQSWVTEAGDVRLTDFDIYDPNTKIAHGDRDSGKQLKILPNGHVWGQAVVGFVDINNDGVYDLCDPLYVDTDGDGSVSVNDVRLTDDVLTSVDESYTLVTLDDPNWDEVLLDPVTYRPDLITPIFSMLGYIDSDCSMTWTCVDKLYLQQLTNGCFGWKESDAFIDELAIDSFVDLRDVVLAEDARSIFLDPCAEITDCLVTIGDFRIYMPPTAIAEGWPECGTKVTQCDIDAVFTLSKDWMLIAYYDVNSNNRFDEEDGLYIDTVFDWQSERWETEAGDVRLTDFCNTYEPNTKIAHGDNDAGKQFKPLPNSYMFGQAVIGFVDLNNDGVYDIGDPLYVNTDGRDTDGYYRVSVNDVRLTDDMKTSADESYTRVTRDDSNWGRVLRDPVTYRPYLVTPIFSLLGYIDADCSMTWTCPDKLYLQQIKSGCYDWIKSDSVIVDLGVDTLDELAIIAEDELSRGIYLDPCEKVSDCVVTIGDLRLYIPPDEICEIPDSSDFNPYDVNENGVIEIGELITAIGDWKTGSLSIGDLIEIIGYWKAGSYM